MLYGVPEDGGSSGVGMDGEGGSDRDSGSALSSHDTRRWLAAVDAEEADRRRAFWQRIKAAREVTEVRGKDDDARLRLLVRSLPAEYRDRVLKIVSAEGATDGATSTLASAMERAGLGSAGAAGAGLGTAAVSGVTAASRAGDAVVDGGRSGRGGGAGVGVVGVQATPRSDAMPTAATQQRMQQGATGSAGPASASASPRSSLDHLKPMNVTQLLEFLEREDEVLRRRDGVLAASVTTAAAASSAPSSPAPVAASAQAPAPPASAPTVGVNAPASTSTDRAAAADTTARRRDDRSRSRSVRLNESESKGDVENQSTGAVSKSSGRAASSASGPGAASSRPVDTSSVAGPHSRFRPSMRSLSPTSLFPVPKSLNGPAVRAFYQRQQHAHELRQWKRGPHWATGEKWTPDVTVPAPFSFDNTVVYRHVRSALCAVALCVVVALHVASL
jgi:hypothetical protein